MAASLAERHRKNAGAAELDAADADRIPQTARTVSLLREIQEGLARHNRAASAQARRDIRTAVAGKMTAVAAAASQPVTLDLKLDCTVVLPARVAREAEAAATVLARLSPHPFATPAWQAYHIRFFERYGIGALAPVLDVTDPDSGLGFPDGYLGTAEPEPPAPASARDDLLLTLAQDAALDGTGEIVLDEPLIARLAVGMIVRDTTGTTNTATSTYSYNYDLNGNQTSINVTTSPSPPSPATRWPTTS
jgi:lantibiotic biosynthesis protein